MSSFFQRLHKTSSSPSTVHVTKVKPQPATQQQQSKAGNDRVPIPAVSRSKPAPVDLGTKSVGNGPHSSTSQTTIRRVAEAARIVARPSATTSLMRRIQSSSTVTQTPPKKRKISAIPSSKPVTVRDISRVKPLSPPTEVKRRRTASPTYRIHRSESDDETDFSEPVNLFRSETPDIVHHQPVQRKMLNPRAGEDLDFRHARELVAVVDKESFVPEDPDNPALDVVLKLPFGEEMYVLC